MRNRLLMTLWAGSMAAACCLICGGGAQAVDHPDLFELTSPDFADNGILSEANAGTGTSLRGPWACGGQNLPPAAKTVARGDAEKFVSGNSGNGAAYHGACAEPGAKAHHFIFMIYALDIGLGKLKPGLTKAEFVQEINGHSLAEASLMGRYQRAADGKAMLSAK